MIMASESISILTFNFLGIPFFSRNYQKRLQLLIEEVAKINPDVLCFQEVWLRQARSYLTKNLKPFGFEYSFHPTSKFRLNGLLTLSKKEISSPKSFVFKPLVKGFDFSFFELFGVKGYSLAKIKLAEEEIFVFNVHLSVDWNYGLGRDSKFALAKLKEIDLLSEAINTLGEQKIIVVGDFNFDPGTFFCKRLLKSGVKNISLGKNSHIKTALPNLYNKFYVPRLGEEIDLVFSKNLSEDSVSDFKVLWNKPFKNIGYLSDHAGVLAKFRI